MKALKICVYTLVMLMGLSTFVFCQRQDDRTEKQLEELKSALQLGDDQAEEIALILAAAVEEEEQNRELYEDDDKEKLEKIRHSLHKKTDEKIMELLTEEQLEKFKTFREDHRKNQEEGDQKRPPRGEGDQKRPPRDDKK